MSKLEQENETNDFEVENSDDLNAVIGTDTPGDNPESEPGSQDDDKETIPKGTEEKVAIKPGDAEQKPKKKSRTQRRIERVTRENADLREQLADQSNAEDKPEELNIDDFEDYDEYITALAEQETKVKKKPKVDAKKQVNKGILNDTLEDGNEDYDDFEELVRANDLALTGDILEEVLESEIASDILYHLASNKDETREIAGMTPRARQKALMKIELSLESKENATVKKKIKSSAPEPITPVNGDSSKPVSLDDDELPFGEYEKEFNRQQASHKSNGWA